MDRAGKLEHSNGQPTILPAIPGGADHQHQATAIA
jgi:hypothetical protein